MACMIATSGRVVVVPFAIVNRDPHFSWIAVIQIVSASVVAAGTIVLWIGHVRIVIKSIQVGRALLAPSCTESLSVNG